MTDVDFFTPGARLALELECLLMDTRNDAAQSRWWASAHEALEQWRQAVRAMEASIDAVQPEASTTLKEAESHAHICAKLAEEHKDDVLVSVALTDAAAIIRDLMRGRLQASQAHPVPSYHDLRKWAETSWNRGFQQGLESNRLLAMQAAEALKKEREAHAETNRAMTEALLASEERAERAEADAARWRYIRRKLCLTGNGDGTYRMEALNLPARIQGQPEHGKLDDFYDAAIDNAIQRTTAQEGPQQ